MNQTFETTTPLTINASVPAGTIEIEATDDAAGTAVDVERLDKELDPSEVELRLRGSEGAQTLEIKLGKWRFKEARYRLLVRTHSGTDLRIDSGAADIRADGVFGSAKVHSASGDIAIQELRGDGNLKTASGDVRVAVAHRDVEMDSASGGVDLGEVHGRAKLHTVSGDVEIGEAHSDVAVRTVSGDSRVGSIGAGELSAHSVSGDVEVGVRPGTRTFVDAHSMSGDMHSDLDLSGAPVDEGGPELEIRAKTMSGDVTIRRVVAENA